MYSVTMANIGWGSLADSESYGTLGDDADDFKRISMETATSGHYTSYQAAAHGMIYARTQSKLWHLYDQRAFVMMQLRFDGVFGFPGGLVDEGETVIDGINREMKEEAALDTDKYAFRHEHHVVSFIHEEKKLVLHFYMMEVLEEDFVAMESKVLSALEYGIETFGTVRVPLHTMGDGLRGLPAFLANHFAGNARRELIHGLLSAHIFSEDEMATIIKACEKFMKSK